MFFWRRRGDWRWGAAAFLIAVLVLGVGFALRAKGLGTAANVAQLVSLAPLVVGIANWPRAVQAASRGRNDTSRLADDLRTIAYAQGLTTGEVRERLNGWEASEFDTYLNGARHPSWEFVIAFVQAVAGDDRWRRELLEQRLRVIWEDAGGSQSRPGTRGFRPEGPKSAPSRHRRPVLIASVVACSLAGVTALYLGLSPIFSDSGPARAASPHRIATMTDPSKGRGGLSVTSLALDDDGTTLAVGDEDGKTYLWNMATRKLTAALPGPADYSPVLTVAFGTHNQFLAAGYSNGNTLLWNVASHKVIAVLPSPAGKYSDTYSVAFSPNGSVLATGSASGNTYLWSIATHDLIATLPGHHPANDTTGYYPAYTIAFSPNGATLAVGDNGGNITIWDIATSESVATLSVPGKSNHSIYSIAYSPNGKTIAAGAGDGNTYLWDVATHELVDTLPVPGPATRNDSVENVVFNRLGTTLAIGNFNGNTYLWNTRNRKLAATLTGDDEIVNGVVFAPDGKTLIAGGEHDKIYLWDVSGYA